MKLTHFLGREWYEHGHGDVKVNVPISHKKTQKTQKD
jgi:hypothetical protein